MPSKQPRNAQPPQGKGHPTRGSQRTGGRDEGEDELIPVVVMGLGHIGRAIGKAALEHPGLKLIGAVDSAPSLAGKSLSEVLGGGSGRVVRDLKSLPRGERRAVLLHATGSRVADILPQLEHAFEAGYHVVSTCEELAYPWLHHADEAERIERAAVKAGVSVLGNGVNPGFVLDRLVAAAGSVSGKVRHAFAERIFDVRTRREALQRKVGAGLTEDEFMARAEKDEVGHMGLPESCALAALGLGLDCDEVEEELLPVMAEEEITGAAMPIPKGAVAGVFQRVRGFSEGREVVCLEVTIAAGAERCGDRMKIDADPSIDLEIKGGVPGDLATAWAMVNAAPSVTRSDPGLMTVLDLPTGR
jgi:4-hydroxy-tetrahydrodipicolinate reductase